MCELSQHQCECSHVNVCTVSAPMWMHSCVESVKSSAKALMSVSLKYRSLRVKQVPTTVFLKLGTIHTSGTQMFHRNLLKCHCRSNWSCLHMIEFSSSCGSQIILLVSNDLMIDLLILQLQLPFHAWLPHRWSSCSSSSTRCPFTSK